MQSVTTKFNELAQGGVRPHKWDILMSFPKEFDDTIDYFTLDSSSLDGTDILKPVDDNPIQYWDFYNYTSYRDRMNSLYWTSVLNFPHHIQSDEAEITLNNYDNFFSPNTNSPIASFILPRRPLRVLAGYGAESTIQQFVGITEQKPILDPATKSAKFNATGFISEISSLRLSNTVALSDVRTDEALVAIFDQFGISPTAYSLEHGRNTIPFLFLESDSTVGAALDKIMSAEGGKLYIDEQGIIRFVERLSSPDSPVFIFNETNVSSSKQSNETEIINRVIVKSTVRDLQVTQPIFFGSGSTGNATLSKRLLVPAGLTEEYEISLENPLSTYSPPTLGYVEDDSWFSVQRFSGVPVFTNVTVDDSYLTAEKLVLVFENTNTFDVYIDAIEAWGDPAKIIDGFTYDAFDEDSIAEFGEFPYEIENDLFGTVQSAESFARTILDAYASPKAIVEMDVKGNYALQLGDIVTLDLSDVNGDFQIIGLSTSVNSSGVEEMVKVKRYEPRHWFTIDVSNIEGDDVIAP